MTDMILAVAVGVKLSVFVALLIYSLLIDIVSKRKKQLYGIIIFACALIVVATIEFFHVVGGAEIVKTTADIEKLNSIVYLLANIFTLIGGLGLIIFLAHVNKNIRDYR